MVHPVQYSKRLIARGRIQAFYSVRSVRQLMGDEPAKQQIVVELPGSGIDDHVWDHSTFAKNRDDCSTPDVCREVPPSGAAPPQSESLSDDHFSVDGTLVEAWASLKSFRAIDGNDEPPAFGRNGERQFHIVQADATMATRRAEREAGLAMIERHDPGDAAPHTGRRQGLRHTRIRRGMPTPA